MGIAYSAGVMSQLGANIYVAAARRFFERVRVDGQRWRRVQCVQRSGSLVGAVSFTFLFFSTPFGRDYP